MEGSTPSPRGRNLGSNASFRESDVEFLQAEAREWLEAVLEEKLDSGTSLQDLLADGTVLYRVSQIVKEHLSKVKGRHSDLASAPDVNRRTSLKYQPYSYVEAFLKVCKDVGLLDLDLFNPSDAVDKKDIRHVCVCLRRLSKKARSLNVQLPEFDNVKHTLLRSPSHKHAIPMMDVVQDSLQQPSNKTPSRFKNEELGTKETVPSMADPQKRDADPNVISFKSDVVNDGSPQEDGVVGSSRESSSMEPMGSVQQAEVDEEATTSTSEDTDSRLVDLTTTTSGDADLRPVETTTSVCEGTDMKLAQTSVSEERNLRPVSHSAMSEKPHVNGMEMTYGGDLCAAKERRKRKGWRPWFPYAAGAAVVFVGAVVVLVGAREKRQPPPVLYEVQSGDALAEIARQTQNS